MNAKKKTIAFKIETTPGVDSGPTGLDAILTSGLTVTPYEGPRVSRDIDRSTFGNSEEINTGPYVTVAFDVELAGAGAPGSVPAWGSLMRACALSETIDAGVDVRYLPVSDAIESGTMYFLLDGELQKIPYCLGNPVLKLEKGQLPKISFTFTGLYQRPAVGTFAPDWSNFQSPLPVNEQNTNTFTVFGYDAVASTFEIDMSNEVTYRNLIGDERVIISDRKPKGKIVIDAPRVGEKDFFALIESHNGLTTGAIEIEHGTTPGHIINISAPKSQLSGLTHTDSDGFAAYDLPAIYLPVAGDDEVMIIVK